jgi:hypothetical protein
LKRNRLLVLIFILLSGAAKAAATLPNAYCGEFKDNGDSFQIIDGIYNAYIEQNDLERPIDLKGIAKYLWKDSPQGKCYCLIGMVESFYRKPRIAYEFKELIGLKSCQNIID